MLLNIVTVPMAVRVIQPITEHTFNGITRDYTIEVIIDDDIFVESK